ncbi:MAG: phosphatase PAP2 family protein [Chitinispirillales bacterium]|nr:phosphatase PAP2 family protein [Chitinispirillales bacterium]
MRDIFKRAVLLCVSLSCCFFGGCSSRVFKANGFEDPKVLPEKSRIGASLKDALFDPYIGITTAALIAVAASGKDKQISSRATKSTPVFGSIENARTASDIFVVTSAGIAAAAYFVKYFPLDEAADRGCPLQTEFGIPPNLYAPVAAAEAAVVSGALTLGTTEVLKRTTRRLRPDSTNTLSFPSAHTAAAAAANGYSIRTISGMSLPKTYSYPVYGTLTALTLATAWGRVEGAKHYPTDILAGALIGTFLVNASYKAFFAPYRYVGNFNMRIAPDGAGAALTAMFVF